MVDATDRKRAAPPPRDSGAGAVGRHDATEARPAAGGADADAFNDVDAFRFDTPRSRRGSATEGSDAPRSGRPPARQSRERSEERPRQASRPPEREAGARSDRRPVDPSETRPRRWQPDDSADADEAVSPSGDRNGGTEAASESGGEDRRRGRRGGRRRRRRGGERTENFRADAEADSVGSFSPEAILDDIRPIDEPLSGIGGQSTDRAPRGFRESPPSMPRGEDRWHGQDSDHLSDRHDAVSPDRHDSDQESDIPRDLDADAGEEEPRKRRRRGRRGGRRRRGRSPSGEIIEGRDEAEPADGTPAPEHRTDTDDDEPLRSGYMGEVARGGDPARRADAGSDGDRGQRRRRGRSGRGRRSEGSGEGTERRSAAERQPTESAGRGRDSEARTATRRGDGGRRSSRSDQGRRSRGGDFKPVAGSLHEDDEGLELLSADETVSSGRDRPSSREEDDVFVESGLADVLDVPSWVEAIGIVIAGNLEARSRPGRPENRGR
jgi:ribonuclease E